MTLYLKYRPQTIDDLDLKAVRDSLQSTLSKPDIPHAFLFAGPKGTGKTSAARIVAKAISCQGKKGVEPCNNCPSCISITRGENLDVIEIDAASHRGIDDIRILREAVKLSPIAGAHKIYIIDEAHMLTTEACNALLKVLEEPPAHVIFILATTNPEKLIDTIRSRTTLVAFTKATEDDVVRRLEKVAKGEGVTVGKDVLGLIAKAADGAFRDAVKIFEQIISEGIPLTKESVSDFLFGNKSFDPEEFLEQLKTKDIKRALEMIEHGISQGVSAKVMAKGILETLRVRMIREVGVIGEEKEDTIILLELFSKAYTEIPSAYLEQLPLEIAVVKWGEGKSYDLGFKNQDKEENIPKKGEAAPDLSSKFKVQSAKLETEEKDEPPKKAEAAPVKENKEQRTENIEQGKERQIAEVQDQVVETRRMTRETDAVVTEGAFSDAMWVKVLAEVRPQNAGTEALLRTCKPMSFDGKVLGISVYYKFHKERLDDMKTRDELMRIAKLLTGKDVQVNVELQKGGD